MLHYRLFVFGFFTCFLTSNLHAQSLEKSLEVVLADQNFVEIIPSARVSVDLKYASTDNFMHKNVYGVFNRAFLHRHAYDKLNLAAQFLAQSKPGFKIIVFDVLRPRSAQYELWKVVVGTPSQNYVANPKSGSVHNYGMAVDLSVLDEKNKLLDMGTPYDTLAPLSQPKLEKKYFEKGLLSKNQIENRKILRVVMEKAGFIQLPNEWWHYDALPLSEVKKKFKIIE